MENKTDEKHENREDHDDFDIGKVLMMLAGLSMMEKVGAGSIHVIVIGESSDSDAKDETEAEDGAKAEEDVA